MLKFIDANQSRHSQTAVRVLLFMLAAPFLAFALFVVGLIGFDCIVSIHSISTRDAAGFSEESFTKAHPGMTAQEVKTILGKPLRIADRNDDLEEWWPPLRRSPLRDTSLAMRNICEKHRQFVLR